MKILVCIKRVPDLESMTFPDSPSNAVEELAWEALAWQMNRYDEYAMEAALQLREARDVTRIDALTVGDHHTEDVLRRAIGMGADHGVTGEGQFRGRGKDAHFEVGTRHLRREHKGRLREVHLPC